MVTHDLSAATEYSSRLVLINRELIYCGKPVITEDITKALYGSTIVTDGGDINA